MNKAVIELGSNINPGVHILKAMKLISELFRLLGESTFVTTRPIGFKDQSDFLNGAVLVSTDLTRHEFETTLKDIEISMGRRPSDFRFGPRIIDLDLIVWNGRIVGQDFYERDFVRNAVLELLPELQKFT